MSSLKSLHEVDYPRISQKTSDTWKLLPALRSPGVFFSAPVLGFELSISSTFYMTL